jgi:hypothetical protein
MFVANGNITPSSFVKLDTTAVGKLLICGSDDPVYGVSQEGTRNPPYTGLDDGYAAIAGENCRVYLEPEECWLRIGSGGCTAGDMLNSDASGYGVTTTTETHNAGALALETGLEGQLIRVRVRTRKHL